MDFIIKAVLRMLFHIQVGLFSFKFIESGESTMIGNHHMIASGDRLILPTRTNLA